MKWFVRRIGVALGASFLLSVAGVFCGAVTLTQADEISVTQWGSSLYGLPYAVAMDKGLFKKAGVDITGILTSSGGGTTVRNILASKTPYGEVAVAAALAAQRQGMDLVIVNVGTRSVAEASMVTMPNANVQTVADLAGKKVVVWHGGSSEYLLLKALAQNHIPDSSVQRVYLQPNQSAAVLHSGQVDAWATWATFSISERANAGEHFLVTGGDIGSQNYAVWAVRNEFATAHPAVVKALYTYLHDAETKQAQNPEAYINVFHTSGPDAVSGKEKDLTIADYKAGSPTSPITAADQANFKEVAQFFADEKVTPGVVDLAPNVLDVTTLAGS